MEPLYKDCWYDNGIYHAITCSTLQLQADSPLLGSSLAFWNSASNTFDFGVGPMSISILNLAMIFGFRLSGLIGFTQAFGAFMGAFMNRAVDYPHGEHIMFLMYWLNRFIFPSASNCITMEWLHLAKSLVSYRDIATGPLILGSIYRALREATIVPINLNVKGPLCMVQIWLQWTFPELRD
ncbi:unnamed protein product [Prunus armeniaca]|uniref:Aminotransferase-like plant mobile domain-containing protein n=1 Tax=Prunus armeniaca TaxID=36596 RepID=A0A6J5VL81_PRUAR|nr:unnamed protein product [Prunus armeniaca]